MRISDWSSDMCSSDLEFWSRDGVEAASIRTQTRMNDRLVYIRSLIPDDSGLEQIEPFMAPLVAMSAFDLGQGRLSTFSSYRFLRSAERRVGKECFSTCSSRWVPYHYNKN